MSGFFTDAELKGAVMLVSIAGASGTGKTRSALLMAKGMAGGDMTKVFVIDTEARRALHHAPLFDPPFKHADMRAPFRPGRFVEMMQAAVDAGALAIVVDNFSDEYEGQGGVIDWAASLGGRPDSWKLPKAAHKTLVNWCRQSRVPVIFCLRAEEKIKIVPDPEKPGKTMPIPVGWMPICEKRFAYDMTVSLTLAPDSRGAIRHDLPMKLPDVFEATFPHGGMITEATGKAMADWLDGAGPPPPLPQLEAWPMVGPDLAPRSAKDARQWASWCTAAIAKVPDATAMAAWNAAMDEHFSLIDQHEPDAVLHVQAIAEKRMDALAAEHGSAA